MTAPLRLVRLAGLLLLLALAALSASCHWLAPLELAVFDTQQRMLAQHWPRQPLRAVVVVGIDEQSYAQFPEPLALWHPYLGAFLRAMAAAKPAVLGLDVTLPERSYDQLVPGYDRKLLEGLLAARNITPVVLGVTVDQGGVARSIYPPFAALAGTDAQGYVLLRDEAGLGVRRYSDRLGVNAASVPTLSGRMASALGLTPSEGWIDYALRPAQHYIPLQRVLQWYARGDLDALRAAFGGKAVLLGAILPFEDRLRQPVNLAPWEERNGGQIPAVLVHAQILASAMQGTLAKTAPTWALALVLLAACLLWLVRLRLMLVLALGAALAGLAFGGTATLLYHGVYLPAGAPVLLAMMALSGRWTLEAIVQLRERQRLRATFSAYVSPQLMEEILAGRVSADMSGSACTACVMFADLRGFTTLSECMAPPAVMALLNRYFEEITDVVHAEGGTLNCIMGDGFMAIFGAPKPMDAPCIPAFAAARRILQALPTLNAQLAAEGKPALSIGIGLNVGPVIAGHVGSRARHDYSAIGDTTNVAARLEGLTKELGYPLVCARDVAQALGFPAQLDALGVHKVKGRAAVDIYGWREPAAQDRAYPAAVRQ